MLKSFNVLRILVIASTLTLTTLAIHTDAQAQKRKGSTGARGAFEKGDNTVAIGVGFGREYDYLDGSVSLPTFIVTYDHGILSNVGPGTIGLGGIIGVKMAHYDYNTNSYRANWTNTIVGVRGTYHLTLLKNKNNKFDPYAGAMAGVRIWHYSNSSLDNRGVGYDGGGVSPTGGPFIGAKYNFTRSFGLWSELGYDVAFFKFGINFNF